MVQFEVERLSRQAKEQASKGEVLEDRDALRAMLVSLEMQLHPLVPPCLHACLLPGQAELPGEGHGSLQRGTAPRCVGRTSCCSCNLRLQAVEGLRDKFQRNVQDLPECKLL